MLVAARFGHVRAVQLAAEAGIPWTLDSPFFSSSVTACDEAAEHGHLYVLLAAHAAGCRWDSHTFARAAAGGHLNIMQRLHTDGCPVDEEATTGACSVFVLGSHNLIAGYRFHSDAAATEHFECLRFAVSCGCSFSELVTYCLAETTGSAIPALAAAARETLEWALALGAPDRYACSGAVAGGNADTLRWLRGRGCSFETPRVNPALAPAQEAKLRASGADDELIDWVRTG